MRFVKTLTITAGTTKISPCKATLRLIKGALTNVEIAFPPGPAGLVSVVILDKNLQIAPANPEETFAWDDHTLSFSMNYPIEDSPYELTVVGWSPNASYDHNITFRFDILPDEKDERLALTDYIARLIGLPKR